MISFAAIDGASNTLGQTYAVDQGVVKMELDTAETWSVASTTPAGSISLRTTLIHELGHALGLAHSSGSGTPVMSAFYTGPAETLSADDRVAISSIYDVWQGVGGVLNDIAVGPSTVGSDVWGLGSNAVSGGFGIYRLIEGSGGSWAAADGGAVRIAVAPGGIPWVVNSLGQVFRRSSSSPTSGTWNMLVGTVKDLAIGADGSVWAIGTDAAPGGFGVWKWNGTGWDKTNDGGAAVRIAVDPSGRPWVINNQGQVWQRSTNSTASGTWTQKATAGVATSATQISISPTGDVWILGGANVGGGREIYVWDEQTAASGTPARAQWVKLQGGASHIAVGSQAAGGVWLVNSAGSVFHQSR